MVSPVIQLAASDTMNAMAAPISSGEPIRLSGVVAATCSSFSFHNASASLVRTTPGATAFTLILGDSSSAICLVMWIRAALEALYKPRFGSQPMPPMDAVLTTTPPCSAIQARAATDVHRIGAQRFTSNVLANRA